MDDTRPQGTESISIVGRDDDEDVDRGPLTNRLVRNVINVQRVEDEIQSFIGAMERIVGNISQQVGNFRVDTISVTAEVNAKGQLSLLGSGGEMGGKGGLTFTFKRNP